MVCGSLIMSHYGDQIPIQGTQLTVLDTLENNYRRRSNSGEPCHYRHLYLNEYIKSYQTCHNDNNCKYQHNDLELKS